MFLTVKNRVKRMSTVYIIDDEEQSANLLRRFVEMIGFDAIIYTSAREFFRENNSFLEDSIIMLDLIMPDMDGIEVMRKLSSIDNTLPLILMSGYDSGILHSAEQLAKAHSLDIIASLTKPIQMGKLHEIILDYSKNKDINVSALNTDDIEITVSDLEDAIIKKQLVLHYQPQVDIKSGSLCGVEALVRWQHPIYGLIYPDAFVPLAEKNGLIGDLTAQVIKLAVEQAIFWKSMKLMLQVSVNISAENITTLSLPEQLSNMLDSHKLDSSMLTLEITESALMGELVTSLDILTRLRMKGIELSIDDFGTGFSSLSQLYRVPFTELKVDRGFVMCMSQDDEARGIVKTCIMLGHELNMHVVAEGVEDAETLRLLKSMGCDIAQGYHIAKPMPADELIEWNKNRVHNPVAYNEQYNLYDSAASAR